MAKRVAMASAATAQGSPAESVGMTRRSGNFPPKAWDYGKIVSSTDDATAVETKYGDHERLINEIKILLKEVVMPLEKLELVDSLQRLGVRYHFEHEIQRVLESLHIEANNVFSDAADMYSTSLLFKVLRENGYRVSQDVFKKFLCPKVNFTNFSEDYVFDVKGIMRLYEASFLGFKGEDLLDMARLFSSKNLKIHMESKMMDANLEKQVKCMLRIPSYWSLMRLQALWTIRINDGTTSMNPIVLKFAKLDYNMVQEIHKREIREITKWWNDLSLNDELKFARDRIVESYIWTMGVIFQPQYGDARKYLTQAVCLLTIIDDMYDVYGLTGELELFTKAIERWDMNSTENLPKYMRLCFLALFNMIHESSYYILKEKDIDVTPYLKKMWENLCKAYLVETKWYHSMHKPLLKEYIKNGVISSGVQLAVSYSYMFTSQTISKEVLNFLQTSPNLINWSGKIFRLNNDISTSSEELKRGDVVKAIECYQHERNISRSEATLHIQGIIMDTWKEINEERFSTSFQIDIFDRCIDVCRASHCFYEKGDGYGSPAKDLVISLLFDNV